MEQLQINGKGWNVDLFVAINREEFKCHSCGNICRDAVELSCEHDDELIDIYCKLCLEQMIIQNKNKCPINNHINPDLSSNRNIRKKILKSKVYCPHSDAKEGDIDKNACHWSGTLSDLLNNHINQCEHANKRYVEDKSLGNMFNLITKHQTQIQSLQATVQTQSFLIDELQKQVSILKLSIPSRDHFALEQKENKNDYQNDDIDEELVVFTTNSKNRSMFEVENNGLTVKHKANGYGMIGVRYFWHTDKYLIHLHIDKIESGWISMGNMGFGFISPKFTKYTSISFSENDHILLLKCNGYIHKSKGFVVSELKEYEYYGYVNCFKGFCRSEGGDTIGISIDMETKEGKIWNLENKYNYLKVSFDNEEVIGIVIGIVIMIAGSDPKSITVTKQQRL